MFNAVILSIWMQIQPPVIPIPGEIERSLMIEIPSGPLPWDILTAPQTTLELGLPAASWSAPDHTSGYASNAEDLQARIDMVADIETDNGDVVDTWFDGSQLPDMSDPDFVTGIDLPGHEDLTAYDIAAEYGSNIGDVFAAIKGFVSIDVGWASAPIFIIVLSIFWMILVGMIIFAIQFADMAFSVIVRIIELIPGE